MDKVAYSFNELPVDLETQAGGKGRSLVKLTQSGFPVPEGFVILDGAFQEDQLLPEAWNQIQAQLNTLRAANHQPAFAIRSSALSEDSEQASFAGEFESRLNLSSDAEILDAICQIHHSRHGVKVQAYSQARGLAATQEVAVVVQKLVAADRSGVMFTANPTNGFRSQVVISAAWGLGEAIVSGTVTPDMIIVEKESQRVVTFQVETKEIMTVRTAGGTQERPVEANKQKQAVLSREEAVRLADLGIQIEAAYGMPVDIEWAAVGDDFSILQARPITALPDPPPPTSWKLPKGAYALMRVNIIELMAEPLSPLFETLGLEVINTGMSDMLSFFLGRPGIMPERPIVSINHYAYYNGSIKPLDIAWLLGGSVGIAKRMFSAPVERWTEQGRPTYVAVVEKWNARNWRDCSHVELLLTVQELAGAAINAYWSMVGGILPAAWISEALFTYVYRIFIRRRGDPEAATFLLGFDSFPIRAEQSLYDLATWAREQEALPGYLEDTPADQLAMDIQSAKRSQSVPELTWNEWRAKVQTHLERYGHTIYDLDFANPVPTDDPAPLLETCKLYVRGEGTNPHERQQTLIHHREATISAVRNRLKGWRLKQFNRFLALAQRFAPLREDALADIGLAYPLLHQMLRFLGQRLAQAGAIDHPVEIYWLTQEEVKTACEKLDRHQPLERYSGAIPERKASRRSAQKTTPPMRLPHFSLPQLRKFTASLVKGKEALSFTGVAASAGCVTARACVLHGPEDFDQMA